MKNLYMNFTVSVELAKEFKKALILQAQLMREALKNHLRS